MNKVFQKQLKDFLRTTEKNLNKDTFKELLINVAKICEQQLLQKKDDKKNSFNYIYNFTRVFLKKHYDIIYNNDDYLLSDCDNAPDVIFGLKNGTIEEIFNVYKYHLLQEIDKNEIKKFEINLVRDSSEIIGNVTISCYTEFFEGTKSDAYKRADELKKFFECEIAKVTEVKKYE